MSPVLMSVDLRRENWFRQADRIVFLNQVDRMISMSVLQKSFDKQRVEDVWRNVADQ